MAVRFEFFKIFRMQVLAERLPLTPIFQNMTFIHYVQRLENVMKIAKSNLPSIYCNSLMEFQSCEWYQKIAQRVLIIAVQIYELCIEKFQEY